MVVWEHWEHERNTRNGVRRYGSIGIMGYGDVGVCKYVSSRENEYGKIVKEGTKEGQGREG